MNDGTKLLALALFLGSIGAFAVWNTVQRSATTSAAEREDLGPLPPDWGAVWIGEPSGADPLPSAERAGFREIPAEPTGRGRFVDSPEPAEPRDGVFELRVQPGQVLSRICALRYGTSNSDLVRRLAEYNGLDNPDDLKVGALLRLPPAEDLLDE